MPKTNRLSLLALMWTAMAGVAMAQEPPAAGTDALTDQIRAAGEIKVGVLAEAPWLAQDTTSGAENEYSGPAWEIAKAVSDGLGVRLAVVPVSHDTKVPLAASGQVDMTIAPLGQTAEREKVVDFVIYSRSSACFVGKQGNPKLEGAKTVDDLNRSGVVVAVPLGTPPEQWVPTRLPAVQVNAVAGVNSQVFLEEIMAGRADLTTIDNVVWPRLSNSVAGLQVWPQGDDCMRSTEMQTPIGLAIGKGHPAFVAWVNDLVTQMTPALEKAELDNSLKMN